MAMNDRHERIKSYKLHRAVAYLLLHTNRIRN